MGSSKKTLCIPLLGKGATNHLHREELVAAFRERGVDILFLVRDDYMDWVEKIPACRYEPYRIPTYSGLTGRVLDLCVNLRYQYPSSDPWRKWRYETIRDMTPSVRHRIFQRVSFFLCRSRFIMDRIVSLEGTLYRKSDMSDLDRLGIDQVLMLGVGTWADNPGSRITWWALKRGVPIVHFMGNYDSLCSKGFRGHPVNRLLVWGSQMKHDAIHFHGISEDIISETGALRYNLASQKPFQDRTAFIQGIGLDPEATTVLFAGSAHEFHYFEMLSVFEELKKIMPRKVQLIVRVYPNKVFMRSAFFHVLQEFVDTLSDVWLSRADKSVLAGSSDRETLQIEDDDLWRILQHSDVVVNIFSTITLEACMFDKPVINMWYFYDEPRVLRQPVHFPYPLTAHIRRVIDSRATDIAYTRKQLVDLLLNAWTSHGGRRAERRSLVEMECGRLDGGAVDRVVSACLADRSVIKG